MDDAAIFTAVRALLVVGLPGVTIWQSDNPTTQGRRTGPTLWMHRAIGDHRYGWMRRSDDVNGNAVEEQIVETMLQINALDPSPTAYPGDLGNAAIDVLQSDVGLLALRTAGLAVLRITDLRTPTIRNDQAEYEVTPSFDVTLQHVRRRTPNVPATSRVTFAGVVPV